MKKKKTKTEEREDKEEKGWESQQREEWVVHPRLLWEE